MSYLKAVWLAVLLGGAPLETLAPQGKQPVDLSLVDQFGHRHAVSDSFGDFLILVYGDKQVETADRQIRDRLDAAFHRVSRGEGKDHANNVAVKPVPGLPPGVRSPDVHVAAVACIVGVPPNMQFIAQRHFAVTSPHGEVLLDFQERMRQSFGLSPGVSHILVFDTYGRLRLRTAGELDDTAWNGLVEAIEALRGEAVRDRQALPNGKP